MALLLFSILVNIASAGTYLANIKTLCKMTKKDIVAHKLKVKNTIKNTPPDILREFFTGKITDFSQVKEYIEKEE